jgi:hypothetical protein
MWLRVPLCHGLKMELLINVCVWVKYMHMAFMPVFARMWPGQNFQTLDAEQNHYMFIDVSWPDVEIECNWMRNR